LKEMASQASAGSTALTVVKKTVLRQQHRYQTIVKWTANNGNHCASSL
jgi:hypothetical protein